MNYLKKIRLNQFLFIFILLFFVFLPTTNVDAAAQCQIDGSVRVTSLETMPSFTPFPVIANLSYNSYTTYPAYSTCLDFCPGARLGTASCSLRNPPGDWLCSSQSTQIYFFKHDEFTAPYPTSEAYCAAGLTSGGGGQYCIPENYGCSGAVTLVQEGIDIGGGQCQRIYSCESTKFMGHQRYITPSSCEPPYVGTQPNCSIQGGVFAYCEFYRQGGGYTETYACAPTTPPTGVDVDATIWNDVGRTTIFGSQTGDGPLWAYSEAPYKISWGAVGNASSCTLNGSPVSVSGGTIDTYAVPLNTTSLTYLLSCTSPSGGTASNSVTINIPPKPTPNTASCPSPGTLGSFSWIAPTQSVGGVNSWGTFYVRLYDSTISPWVSVPAGYSDNYIGISTTSATVAGKSYYWNVHSKLTSAPYSWSDPVGAGTTCATTINTIPVLGDPSVTSITASSAVMGGNILSDGGAAITARGTCLAVSPTAPPAVPNVACVPAAGTAVGTFSHTRTGLTAGNTYNYRAYATNSVGTGYSTTGTFTTIPPTPTGLSVSASTCGNNWLNISWNSSLGAANYQVYRDGGGTPVYSGAGLAFSDTGLVLGSTHTYTVRATNSSGSSVLSSSVSGTVANACAGGVVNPSCTDATPWYSVGGTWNYRKIFQIDDAKVPSSQSNFPVMIYLTSDAGLQANAQPDADDILFTNSDGTKLYHEIEKYNSSTGELIAWVKVLSLSSTEDTKIYMYYGNTSAANQQNATSVWDSNYSAVWHLPNGTTLSALDSTSNGNNGTITGPTAIASKINGGANYDGATTRFISTPRVNMPTGNSNYTTSAWIYLNSSSLRRKIFSYGATANYQFYGLGISPSDYVEIGHWANDWTSTVLIPENTWTYITNVYTGSNKTDYIYINGSLVQSHAGVANNNLVATNSYIGRYFTSAESSWIGIIDDLRFSKSARSAEWIATEYNNQSNPAMFYGVSAQCPLPISTTADIGAGSTNIAYNTATNITWSSTNATSCTVTPPNWTGTSGTQSTGNLTASKTYTLSCNPGPVSDSVTVNVTPPVGADYNLCVVKSGQGTVSRNPIGTPDIPNCWSYPESSTVILTATPSSGRIFTGWGAGCNSSTKNPDGSGGTCTVNMSGNKSVTANFAIDPTYREF